MVNFSIVKPKKLYEWYRTECYKRKFYILRVVPFVSQRAQWGTL